MGEVKANVDGGWDALSKKAGFGLIVRDDAGRVIISEWRQIAGCNSAEEAEENAEVPPGEQRSDPPPSWCATRPSGPHISALSPPTSSTRFLLRMEILKSPLLLLRRRTPPADAPRFRSRRSSVAMTVLPLRYSSLPRPPLLLVPAALLLLRRPGCCSSAAALLLLRRAAAPPPRFAPAPPRTS
ncbi:hypothetical protein QYE76_032988 [Lolium multiflorum]|uniref:RNase H type-1 domain-containing protein n=1 Tax=Lolium multiflorum TaxID=4521 RepID=A0AAD8QUH3_LOLMU|nr:hypothetical protein QYE76_032988 [Lolium multiflorum]